MYESPIKVNNLEFGPVISEGFDDDHSIHNIAKKAAESVAEQYDRYVIHQVALTGVTVDRDELIKALRYDRDQYTKGYHDGMERGIEISYPTWIPVTERLPDSNTEYVLCCGSKGGMFVGWAAIKTYDGSGKCTGFLNSGKGRSFTHWMPLPKPPKGEKT